jgi:hypothetical protein
VDDYAGQLADAVDAVVVPWLTRLVAEAARRATGAVAPALAADATAMAASEGPRVAAKMRALLALDVEQQPTNPLSVLRDAVGGPTEVLRRHGVPAPRREEFAAERFPADVYALSPATWADVDPSLQEPGLLWGAWKAGTILQRRRDAGMR